MTRGVCIYSISLIMALKTLMDNLLLIDNFSKFGYTNPIKIKIPCTIREEFPKVITTSAEKPLLMETYNESLKLNKIKRYSG